MTGPESSFSSSSFGAVEGPAQVQSGEVKVDNVTGFSHTPTGSSATLHNSKFPEKECGKPQYR
jgi:hypothetical protein